MQHCLIILFILSGGKNFIKLYGELSKVINVYDTITTNYYGKLDKNKFMVFSAIEKLKYFPISVININSVINIFFEN